jgi:hypothetical protein
MAMPLRVLRLAQLLILSKIEAVAQALRVSDRAYAEVNNHHHEDDDDRNQDKAKKIQDEIVLVLALPVLVKFVG